MHLSLLFPVFFPVFQFFLYFPLFLYFFLYLGYAILIWNSYFQLLMCCKTIRIPIQIGVLSECLLTVFLDLCFYFLGSKPY